MVRRHNLEQSSLEEEVQKSVSQVQKSVSQVQKSVSQVQKSVSPQLQNVTSELQSVTSEPSPHIHMVKHTCSKCMKSFCRKGYAKKHEDGCNGVQGHNECPNCHAIFASRTTLWRHRKQGCEALSSQASQVTINNNTTNITNNNITNNNNTYITYVNVNPFGKEDVSFITPEFARACLMQGHHGIIPMMDTIYFNPEHPENHNVMLRSLNHSVVDIKADQESKWHPEGLVDTIDRMIHRSGNHIICKSVPHDFENDEVVANIDSIQNIKPEAKRKLREKTKARLIQRRQTALTDDVDQTSA